MVDDIYRNHTFFVSSTVMPDDEKTRTLMKYDIQISLSEGMYSKGLEVYHDRIIPHVRISLDLSCLIVGVFFLPTTQKVCKACPGSGDGI